jgi:hypothetical protein
MKVAEDNGLPLQAGQHELQLLLRELSAPPGTRERLPADARLSDHGKPRLGTVS